MNELTFIGIALTGFSILGGCWVLGNAMTAKAAVNRKHIEDSYEKQISDLKREANSWRMAYEVLRAEHSQTKSRLAIQNQIMKKIKLKELNK